MPVPGIDGQSRKSWGRMAPARTIAAARFDAGGAYPRNASREKARVSPGFFVAANREADQRCLMISSANSLHFTSVAPSIRRAKS